MNVLKNIVSNAPSMFHKLGAKLPDAYRLGKKVLGGAIKLGEKYIPLAEKVVQNPYVQTAVSLLPYGSTVGKAVQGGVGFARSALEKGKQLQGMLDRGEALYNQFRNYSAMNQNKIPQPSESQRENLMRSNRIERKPENIPNSLPVNPISDFQAMMANRSNVN